MKKFVFLSAVLLLFAITGKGQLPELPKNIQSPNAAGLGMYGDIPVSLFTGLPQIEIPLYEVNEGQIKVPISLSYHASGFRPDQHPGWVGMGWTLNAGGCITRTVKDLPDDRTFLEGSSTGEISGCIRTQGYYHLNGALRRLDWNTISAIKEIAQSENFLEGQPPLDTEPDEFNFSFMGYSGKFYLDTTLVRTWRVKSEHNIKIIFDHSTGFLPVPTNVTGDGASFIKACFNNFSSFSGFTLITEDGTQYLFGGETNAIEYSINFFNQNNTPWIADSWSLTKIIYPDGKKIEFIYERDDYINQMYLSNIDTVMIEGKTGNNWYNVTCSGVAAKIKKEYHGTLNAPVYLKKIKSTNGEVIFNRSTSIELRYPSETYDYRNREWNQFHRLGIVNYHPDYFLPVLQSNGLSSYPICLNKLQWKKLDEIEIYVGSSKIRRFVFQYETDISSIDPETEEIKGQKRLQLNSVVEYPVPTAQQFRQYSFKYNLPRALPPYLSDKTDHWGFYNGRPSNMSPTTLEYAQAKEPDANFLLEGILSQITYPTGGITEFTFEPHHYGKQLKLNRWEGINSGYNLITGGVRIRKIKSYDPQHTDRTLLKEYFYGEGFNLSSNRSSDIYPSSGVLGGQVQYNFLDFHLSPLYSGDPNFEYRVAIGSTISILPGCNNTHGSHIGYSEVAEVRNNGEGGYTKYFFSNFDNGYGDESFEATVVRERSPYQPYNSNEHTRGKLIKQEDYNSTEVLMKRIELKYEAMNKNIGFVPAVRTELFPICPGSQTGQLAYSGTAYKIYTYAFLPVKKTETIYDINGSNPVTTSIEYNYNTQNLLKEEKTSDSKGDVLTVQYNYIDDILPKRTGSTTWTAVGAYKQMSDKFMIGIPLETIKKYTSAGTTTAKTLSAEVNLFKKVNTNSILPAERRLFLPDAPSTAYVPFAITNTTTPQLSLYSGLINESTYTSYDIEGNIQEYVGKDGVVTTFIWGYNRQYPVVKVIGDTYTNVKAKITAAELTTLQTTLDDTPLATLTNKIRTGFASSDVQVFTYTYKPHVGLSSETDPNGITTYYEYDDSGRLLHILDNDKNIVKKHNYHYREQQ